MGHLAIDHSALRIVAPCPPSPLPPSCQHNVQSHVLPDSTLRAVNEQTRQSHHLKKDAS